MQTPNPLAIRILVVDDHTLFRRGLMALLARDPVLVVVGDAADAGQALRKAVDLQPDLILLDNHLSGVSGVDALPDLREAAPQARILMLTVSEDEQDLAAALRGGAAGYLLKTMDGDALTQAIQSTMRGDSVIAPEMTSKLVSAYRDASTQETLAAVMPVEVLAPTKVSPADNPSKTMLSTLSPREHEILRGIASGASNKQIARDCGIAETTVKIHVQHILRKLDVSSRVHAAVIATELSLL